MITNDDIAFILAGIAVGYILGGDKGAIIGGAVGFIIVQNKRRSP